MAFTPLSAKNAQVRIGTSVLTAKKWSVTPKTDALDITNFEGVGYGDYIGGIIDADISIEFDWDSAADSYANPPNLAPTAIVGPVKLYVNTTASAFWNFPLALVVEAPQNAEVRGLITGSVTMKSKGTYTAP